jgi:hypothetical protein
VVEVRILGPVEVATAGQTVEIQGVRLRALTDLVERLPLPRLAAFLAIARAGVALEAEVHAGMATGHDGALAELDRLIGGAG